MLTGQYWDGDGFCYKLQICNSIIDKSTLSLVQSLGAPQKPAIVQ